MVSAFSDDPLLAQTFLTEFVATEETLLRMFEGNPRPPAYIPALEQIDDEDIAAFSVASEGGLPMPAIPEMSGVWSAWGDAVTLIFQGSSEGAEAFQNAAAQIREGIGAPEPTPVPEGADMDSGSEAEISLLIWADEVRAPIMEELAADFEAEYGIGLDVQQLAFGDVRDQFKVAAPAGEGPDIIIGAHDWLGELVVNGLVEPMDLAGKDADFVDPALQAFSYEGQLYGMPYLTENVAFFYNPELVPEAPTTWDEVIEIAQSLEEAGTVEQGYVLHQGDAYHFFPIQTSFGGYVFGQNADGSYNADDVGIDTEGSVAAAEWLEARIAEGTLVADMEWDAMHSMFENGESAMFITGPWALERIRESGVSYAIAPIPAGTEEGRPFLGVQGFMVSAFSEDPLLAQTFLTEFVATEETMQKMFEADPRGPAFIPVLETVEDEDIVAFAEAGANALPMPAIPEMSSVWSAWGDAITLIFQGSDSGDTAFQNAAEQIRTAIQEGQ
jgi:maltose/maltodextrin transport system substrate-binding protein/arabinogalactan oligomer/maltooligosaccharide transport system substrate-binding protein